MFYGFSGNRRKKAEENERETYRPWQGGIYGGLLVFEAGGKTYEMTRVFGRREGRNCSVSTGSLFPGLYLQGSRTVRQLQQMI